MMYLFLICHNPAVGLGPDDPPTLQPQHATLSAALRAEGRRVSGGAPLPYDPQTVVRVQGSRRYGTDGAFATKEVVGGYYIVECRDAADAEAVGMRIPVASNASVQIRPLFVHDSE